MRSCQCPNCEAKLFFDEDREFGFCQYCGSKIILDDFRSIHRIIDEAKIKEAELDTMVRLKELELRERELELEKKELERGNKGRIIAYIVAAILLVFGIVCHSIVEMSLVGSFCLMFAMIVGLMAYGSGEDARNRNAGKIKITTEMCKYKRKNYLEVENQFKQCGFNNIKFEVLYDIKIEILKTSGAVESVSINGEEPRSNKWYMPNAQIVITYHESSSKGFANRAF